ncbi:hypothetical protein V493_03409 [Pseudogymnoascus sp. VKM F-4281 (FW-2241)]|nr:hypothetical protein V493_03409 [Pseudogymnoascus sp. VKM F-4281 (FW-2241)]
MSGRSSYTTTSVSYGGRSSSSSVSSRGSAGYDNYRVPVSGSSSRYGSSNDRVYSVTRNGVEVINHKQRMSDSAEPRSSDASRYYGGSSYKR